MFSNTVKQPWDSSLAGRPDACMSNMYQLFSVACLIVMNRCMDLLPFDFCICSSCHFRVVENQVLRLQVWDTAGQERFRSMAPLYYRHADAALIVYDVTKAETFQEVAGWVQELKDNAANEVILCIVGNKLDLEGDRAVSVEEGRVFAHEVGATFWETSAVKSTGECKSVPCVHVLLLTEGSM